MRAIDEIPRAADALLQRDDERIAGKRPAREREIGRGRAVEVAEPAHAERPELLRAAPRLHDEAVELLPAGATLVDESCKVHGVEYDDRLTIATPEGVEVNLTLAGAASRFVAATIDLLIELVLLIALGLVFGLAGPGFDGGVGVGGVRVAQLRRSSSATTSSSKCAIPAGRRARR